MAAMCEEYCGTDEVEVGLAQEASEKAMRAMRPDTMALMSGDRPEPVRVVVSDNIPASSGNLVVVTPQCAPLLADVPPETAYERVTRRAGTRTRVEGVWPPERPNWRHPLPTGTPVQRLLRLCEELIECEHPDADTQWYGKRLAEIKAELGGEG